MKLSTAFLVLLTTLLTVRAEEKWVSIFNGKNLTGWSPKIRGCPAGENFKNTFRVEDGVIKVSYSEYENFDKRFGHLFYEKKFSDYKLRLQYRFTGEQVKGGEGWALRNSGIMIHSEAPATMELEQDFPTSLEVQLLGGNGKDERSTANLCTPGTLVVMDGKLRTEHCMLSKSKTFHGEQWVTVEVEVHRSELIKHFVNGEEVMSYSNPQLGGDAHADALAKVAGDKMISEGYFCLQSESHPIEFKNIEIMDLSKAGAAIAKPDDALVFELRADGLVQIGDATLDTARVAEKLKAVAASSPDKVIRIRSGKDVPYSSVTELLEMCKAAGLTKVSLEAAPSGVEK